MKTMHKAGKVPAAFLFPQIDPALTVTVPIAFTPLCLLLSTTQPAIHGKFKEVRRRMADMPMADIIQRYFGKYFPQGFVPWYTATGKAGQ